MPGGFDRSLPAATTLLPLLGDRPLDRTLAWRDGARISAGEYLAEANALAGRLPPAVRLVNLCEDRYLFALGLGAALLRGTPSLLPPNAMPATLRRLDAAAAPLAALIDRPGQDTGGLPAIEVTRVAPRAGRRLDAPCEGEPVSASCDGERELLCLLTSGSTGAPQPQWKRWSALTLNIAAEAERLAALLDLPSVDGLHLVATVPPQHSYGLESSVLLALLGGAAFHSGRPFYPADIADALAALPRPRGLVTTPFHLKALLLAGAALPPVDLVLSATAPLSPQLAAQAERATGGRLVEIYGCTEAGQVAARRTTAGEVWTTLGALRLHAERGDDGSERFIVAGGHVGTPTPLADVLELVDERRFRLLGRANDLIHVAGKRSSLAHLNFHLNRIHGVDDGAFWLPDDVPGAVVRPVAFVVAPRLAAAQIIAALRRELEPAFVPRRVVHVDALPREATGKLTAQGLREFALATLARASSRESRRDEARPTAAGRDAGPPRRQPDGQDRNMVSSDRSAGTIDIDCLVAADHPAFAGHFPGAPVLPGAVLLAMVMRSIAERSELAPRIGTTPRVEQVKFLAPVAPGDALRLRLAPRPGGCAAEVLRGSTPILRAQIVADAVPNEPRPPDAADAATS